MTPEQAQERYFRDITGALLRVLTGYTAAQISQDGIEVQMQDDGTSLVEIRVFANDGSGGFEETPKIYRIQQGVNVS